MKSYECGFCGSKYDTIAARMQCEKKCEKEAASKERTALIAKKTEEVSELRETEKTLLANLKETRKAITIAEKELDCLKSEECNGCKDSECHSYYEVNGKEVDCDEFIQLLSRLLG